MRASRRAFAAALAAAPWWLAAGPALAAHLQPSDDPNASEIWQKVRASLLEGREVQNAPAGALVLDVPARALDAAVVPLAVHVRLPAGQVARIFVVIDANPSPVSAIFRFPGDAARADVETRVRVDDYSWVRAVAETTEGRLYGVARFVKASGGCSAPAGSDAAAALATLGRMSLRVDGDPAAGRPLTAQLAISHPNHSGMAMDQATRQITPAHYVRNVDVTLDGKPVFSADVDFSISENPNFRFPLAGPLAATSELRAVVVDSQGRRFEIAQPVRSAAR